MHSVTVTVIVRINTNDKQEDFPSVTGHMVKDRRGL